MERKDFLKKMAFTGFAGLAAISAIPFIDGCKKEDGDCYTDAETAGPFPTKSPADLVLEDITGDRTGTPLIIQISINNINDNCSAWQGAVVDIWHCDNGGNYSEYGGTGMQSIDYSGKHFLRGRQTSNADGLVAFESIYPGWYQGRAPHIHVHIYNASGKSLLITQIAFPENVSSTVYSQGVYASHGQADTSNASDNVFNDSIANELATVNGNPTDGYTLTHAIYVKA
jgi:protocatechuate 3,4-dioxygenase beta subunit